MGDHAVNRFVEEVTVEPDAIARAREAALELGAEPISAAVGVQCATIAAVGRALRFARQTRARPMRPEALAAAGAGAAPTV